MTNNNNLEVIEMNQYIIKLYASCGDKEPTTFCCSAINESIAIKQVHEAYPLGSIIYITMV